MTEVNPQTPAPTDTTKEQTPPNGAPPAEINEDVVKNHPLFKDLEGKYSAAERDKNRFKGRLDKVQKGISDEPDEKPEPEEETPYATKDDLWEMKNAADLEVYGDDQYKQDVAAGIPRDYALDNARLRFQANPDKARLERQQAMASGTSVSTRNLEANDLEGFNEADAKKWGYSKETWLKQQQMKKARGQL